MNATNENALYYTKCNVKIRWISLECLRNACNAFSSSHHIIEGYSELDALFFHKHHREIDEYESLVH